MDNASINTFIQQEQENENEKKLIRQKDIYELLSKFGLDEYEQLLAQMEKNIKILAEQREINRGITKTKLFRTIITCVFVEFILLITIFFFKKVKFTRFIFMFQTVIHVLIYKLLYDELSVAHKMKIIGTNLFIITHTIAAAYFVYVFIIFYRKYLDKKIR